MFILYEEKECDCSSYLITHGLFKSASSIENFFINALEKKYNSRNGKDKIDVVVEGINILGAEYVVGRVPENNLLGIGYDKKDIRLRSLSKYFDFNHPVFDNIRNYNVLLEQPQPKPKKKYSLHIADDVPKESLEDAIEKLRARLAELNGGQTTL